MVPNDKVECDSNNGVVSYKHKYRELKRRLKYLVYENECFEHDVREAQTKLLQLCREKSFLLDQLMRHETIVLSEDSDNETTDYSTEDDEYMDKPTRSTPVAKASKPGPSSLSKSSSSKSTTKTTPTTKKTAQKGVVKQQATGKTAKAVTKTLKSVAPKAPLIVSLPFTSYGQATAASTPTPPQVIGEDTSASEVSSTLPAMKGSKITYSSSSNSSSSSDSDSDDSSSNSSSSSDKEIEPMDTAQPPPPLPPLVPPPPLSSLPKIVDRSPVITGPAGSKVVHPKPIPSPVTPNQLTSIALVSPTGFPLISPFSSSSSSSFFSSSLPAEKQKGTPQTTYALTTTSQGSLELVPLTPTLTTSNTNVLASLTKSSGMSAFRMVTTPTSQHPPSGLGDGSNAS